MPDAIVIPGGVKGFDTTRALDGLTLTVRSGAVRGFLTAAALIRRASPLARSCRRRFTPPRPPLMAELFEIGDITVRHTLAGVTVFVVGAALITGATTAHAMGTGNPYQDHQVGVSFVVYEPTTTIGLAQTDTGGPVCTDGSDVNLVVTYGTQATTELAIWEGNPICADPDGDGKRVARPKVLGRASVVTAFCDPADSQAWKGCSAKDVGRFGGSLDVTLPGSGSLSQTRVTLVTDGKHPLSYPALLRVARSMKPVSQ